MLPWQGGFALVIASNVRGLKLASPKQGMVTLEPDDLAEQFPEGIELLLMERSNATPDQKFGPGWFWPALKRNRGVLIQVLAASFVVAVHPGQPVADPGDHRQGNQPAQSGHLAGARYCSCGRHDLGGGVGQPQDVPVC